MTSVYPSVGAEVILSERRKNMITKLVLKFTIWFWANMIFDWHFFLC